MTTTTTTTTTDTTTTPTLDIDRLREAVEWAEREHERDMQGKTSKWEQDHWIMAEVGNAIRVTADGERKRVLNIACGSTGCIAGNVCAGERDTFIVDDWHDYGRRVDAEEVLPRGSKEPVFISDRARDLLGIFDDEADRLFDGSNSISDVRDIATEIAADRGLTL